MKAAGRKRSTGLRGHSRGLAEDRVGQAAQTRSLHSEFHDSGRTRSWQGCSSAVARAGRGRQRSGWAAFESRMGLEALYLGSAANPAAMRGSRVNTGFEGYSGACADVTGNARIARLVVPPVVTRKTRSKYPAVDCLHLLARLPALRDGRPRRGPLRPAESGNARRVTLGRLPGDHSSGTGGYRRRWCWRGCVEEALSGVPPLGFKLEWSKKQRRER